MLLLDDEGKHLRQGAAPSLPDFYNEAVEGMEIGPGEGSCGTAAATGEVVVVEDVMTHPYWKDFKDVAAKAGLGACWSQPIKSATGTVLGTFAMYYREPREPTPADIESIEAAAQVAGIAIERKRMEAALGESEGRLRGAVESLQEGFALFDADDRVVALNDRYGEVNPFAQQIMERGGTYEDILRANIERGVLVEAIGREEEFIRERLERHRNPTGPIIRQMTDDRWFMLSEARTPEGGIALSFIDITDLKHAEEALTESRERFKDLAEAGSDWFWEMDENLRFTYFSERRQALTELPANESVGMTRWEVAGADPDKDEKWRQHRATMEAHEAFRNFEYGYLDARGRRLVTRVSGNPVFDEDGAFTGYRGTATDSTQRFLAEEALQESQPRLQGLCRSGVGLVLGNG